MAKPKKPAPVVTGTGTIARPPHPMGRFGSSLGSAEYRPNLGNNRLDDGEIEEEIPQEPELTRQGYNDLKIN